MGILPSRGHGFLYKAPLDKLMLNGNTAQLLQRLNKNKFILQQLQDFFYKILILPIHTSTI